jgi:hypothetical protein
MASEVPQVKQLLSVRPVKPAAPAEQAAPKEAPASPASASAGDQYVTAQGDARRSALAWEKFAHTESADARKAAEEAAQNGDHRRAASLFKAASDRAATQRDALDAAKAANAHVHDGFLSLNKHEEYIEAVANGIVDAAKASKTFAQAKEALDFALHHADGELLNGRHFEQIDAAADEAAYQALTRAKTKEELLELKGMINDFESRDIVDALSYTREVLDERLNGMK